MRVLYHWPLDPASRTIRLALTEKQLEAEFRLSPPWKPDPEISRLAPGAASPVLIHQGSHGRLVASGTQAILEYLEEEGGERLLPGAAQDRAEVRRLWRWCEDAFADVNASLLTERITMWIRRDREPDSAALRTGAHALRGRITFLNALAGQTAFLAGRNLSLVDLSAAAHLSCYDYFGDVQWDLVPELRVWYAQVKSRPSFRPLLADRVEGARPARHYADLDF